MVMDLVSAVACETARSASRIERLARTFIWVIPFRGGKVCDNGLNDEARLGNRGARSVGGAAERPTILRGGRFFQPETPSTASLLSRASARPLDSSVILVRFQRNSNQPAPRSLSRTSMSFAGHIFRRAIALSSFSWTFPESRYGTSFRS